jgi:hypothetical protein
LPGAFFSQHPVGPQGPAGFFRFKCVDAQIQTRDRLGIAQYAQPPREFIPPSTLGAHGAIYVELRKIIGSTDAQQDSGGECPPYELELKDGTQRRNWLLGILKDGHRG